MSESNFWDSHVFALICSDAVHRGLARGLLRAMRTAGFTPVAAHAVRSDPEMIDELYSDLIAGQWQTWRYRLVDASLGLGPSVAVICRYTGQAADPHKALSAIKGHSHPEKAGPGTLRQEFASINTVLSLLHTSDDAAEAAREAAIFGLGEHSVTPGADERAAADEIEHLCALADGARPDNRGFCEVLGDVRARILVAVRPLLPPDVRGLLAAEFAAPERLGDPKAGEVLARLVAGAAPPEIVSVLHCGFTPEWRDRIRMRAVDDALAAHGVRLDPFEHLVLESSLHFPPRVDARFADAARVPARAAVDGAAEVAESAADRAVDGAVEAATEGGAA